MRSLVFAAEPGDLARVRRTLRSLAAAKIEAVVVPHRSALIEELDSNQPQWLLRAGSWQPYPAGLREIPLSASGRPLIGIGSCEQFRKDFASVYVTPAAARVLAAKLKQGAAWKDAVGALTRSSAFRCVPLHDIDVKFDLALRVVQLVTTIQFGGAERVALDVADECNRAGIPTVVAALAEPTRRSFSKPAYFANLCATPFAPEPRSDAVERLVLEWGADLVHAHLIKASEAEAIRGRGIPLAITVHNMPLSWPAGYLNAPAAFADLFVGCAEAVSREVTMQMPHSKVRTVWNGIDPRRGRNFGPSGGDPQQMRDKLGWDASDFVLLAIANPRSQKRLERLPEIVVRLEERVSPRRVRLMLAGEPATGSEDARIAMCKFEAEVERWHIRKALYCTGAVDDVGSLLAVADAFVSTSAAEGLSLAQLEALAAGLPVVTTNVGGAKEVESQSDRMFVVPPDADANAFAKVLAPLANAAPPRLSALPKSFTRERMAARLHLLYRGMLVNANVRRSERRPVWLLTNNFCTGGAQSSGRRLLDGLAARGHIVHAATIEEAPERESPGRRALLSGGIRVEAVAPHPNPEALVEALLDKFVSEPPRAVLFWNLITSVKVLLADTLLDIPIFDVSPGEMYFRSLKQFFDTVPPGLPVENARGYGRRLAGVVVKYGKEATRAKEVLGAQVHVIANGVPITPLRERRYRKRIVIGTAARLSPDKRLDELIAALHIAHRQMPEYELRIAGGPDAGDPRHFRTLRQLARGLPVKWCGHVEDIANFMGDVDIFAMISEPAGCPNASLEAMASGLPIVATDHGGAAEQVVDGLNGLLTPRGDSDAFARSLLRLVRDPALRRRMSQASRERAETGFSLDRMIDSYSALVGLA